MKILRGWASVFVFMPLCFFASPGHAADCLVERSHWRGAYYHKLLSPDGFYGFSGKVTLPQFFPDESCPSIDRKCRYFRTSPDQGGPVTLNGISHSYFDQSLDAASVYIGCSKQDAEIDAGLNWEPITRDNDPVWVDTPDARLGRQKVHQFLLHPTQTPPTLTDPTEVPIATGWTEIRSLIQKLGLRPYFAYVPFWRTDAWHADPSLPFIAGEKVQMQISTSGDGQFTLTVQSLTAPEFAVKQSFYFEAAKDTDQKGFACKRVNSIDQFLLISPQTIVGNESGFIPDPGVQTTHARAIGAEWHEALLLNKVGEKIPFAPPFCTWVRGEDTWDRTSEIYRSKGLNPLTGGEQLSIEPEPTIGR